MQKEQKTIKELQSQVQALKGEVSALTTLITTKQRELSTKKKIIDEIESKIRSFATVHTPIISEHAIIRYYERVCGVDFTPIKNEILSSDVQKMLTTLGGNGTIPNNGYKVICKNYVVVSITK